MQLQRSPSLPDNKLHGPAVLLSCALALACGSSGGGDTDSASASGTSNITTVGVTTPEPTTGAGTDIGGEADATATGGGSQSGASSSGAGAESTGPATSGSTGTGPDDTGPADTGPGEGDSSSSAPIGEPMPCQVEATEVKPIPPTVLFLLDKSGSMGNLDGYLWDHDNNIQTPDVTRWSSLYAVVESLVDQFQDNVEFGVKLYPKLDATPYKNGGACEVTDGVEVETALNNAATILDTIPPAEDNVEGGTPMEGGIKEAYEYLTALDPDDQRFILMIADGDISKTCEDQDFNEALIYIESALQDHDIATYVVGIAIDDLPSKTQLTKLANAGGKPSNGPDPYYSTQNQIELDDALQKILDDTLSCTIAVDPEPDQPDLFQVWIDGDQIPAAPDCDADGWRWTVPHSEIELCGSACQALKQTGKVEARYFCIAG